MIVSTRFFFVLLIGCAFSSGVKSAVADVELLGTGVAVVEDFVDFRGAGFAPSGIAGGLDSNTYRAVGLNGVSGTFGGTHTMGGFARGEAPMDDVSEGGIYGFNLGATLFGIGVQPTDDVFTPGEFTVRVRNMTGGSIDGIRFSAQGFFFNDTDRSTSWTLSVSTDDVDYMNIGSPLISGAAPQAMPAWDLSPISGTVITPLAHGDQFYLKFTGIDVSGTDDGRDQFALDNLSFTAIPEPSSMAALALLVCPMLRRSRR